MWVNAKLFLKFLQEKHYEVLKPYVGMTFIIKILKTKKYKANVSLLKYL